MKYLLVPIAALSIATAVLAENVTQFSTYTGLIQRLYDGFVDFETVLSIGNHGIGTTDKLNGELIILDGKAYRINFEGEVEHLQDQETTPYVTLAEVNKSDALLLDLPAGTTYDGLDAAVAKLSRGEFQNNFPYAIRIEGVLTDARLRSIPKLEKPYLSLTEVATRQNIFNFEEESFTLIGFWNPGYADAFNPPKWHIHGLDEARKAGGHVLAFTAGEGVKVYLWKLAGFDIRLPDTEDFAEADFSSDLSDQVQKVNRGK